MGPHKKLLNVVNITLRPSGKNMPEWWGYEPFLLTEAIIKTRPTGNDDSPPWPFRGRRLTIIKRSSLWPGLHMVKEVCVCGGVPNGVLSVYSLANRIWESTGPHLLFLKQTVNVIWKFTSSLGWWLAILPQCVLTLPFREVRALSQEPPKRWRVPWILPAGPPSTRKVTEGTVNSTLPTPS